MTGKWTGNGDKRRYFLKGNRGWQEVAKEAFEEVFPNKPIGLFGTEAPSHWPIVSDALAVHPDQVEEARASAEAHGVPTEVMPDGRIVIRSREHQFRYCRAYGFYNRDENR